MLLTLSKSINQDFTYHTTNSCFLKELLLSKNSDGDTPIFGSHIKYFCQSKRKDLFLVWLLWNNDVIMEWYGCSLCHSVTNDISNVLKLYDIQISLTNIMFNTTGWGYFLNIKTETFVESTLPDSHPITVIVFVTWSISKAFYRHTYKIQRSRFWKTAQFWHYQENKIHMEC